MLQNTSMAKNPYKHLGQDPVMAQLINRFGNVEIKKDNRDLFTTLVRSIIGQQLSVKAAASIYKRFVLLLKSQYPMDPSEIVALDSQLIREAGISYAKIKYIKSLAESVLEGSVSFDDIAKKSNEQVIEELIQVKGIGVWTAEMFLIGALGREDVFSIGDLGLRKAVALHYGIEKTNRKEIITIAQRWSPYRSYACIYLWKSLDNIPN